MTPSVLEFLSLRLPASNQRFRRNPSQLEYTSSIATAVNEGAGKIHLIEGDTGIGKSLAYLLTLAEWITAGEGRQAVVSTFSRALQRQLCAESNRTIVAEFLQWMGRRPIKIAMRMGKPNYVCPQRLEAILGSELAAVAADDSVPEGHRQLAHWALHSDGCLLDLDDEALPDGVTRELICLHRADPTPEHLREVFRDICDADIQIINHSLLVVDLVTQRSITAVKGEEVLLLDEAEHFPQVARDQLALRLSFGVTRRLLDQLGLQKAGEMWRTLFHTYHQRDLAGQAQALTPSDIDTLSVGIDAILKSRPRKARLDDAVLRYDWEQLRTEALRLSLGLAESSPALAISYSPVEGLPSVSMQDNQEGGIIKVGAADRTTIMTSATLSDLRHGPGEPPSYEYLRKGMAISMGGAMIGLEHSHQALDFGRATFALPMPPVTPLRVDEDGQFRLQPRYAKFVWNDLQERLTGRCLLLCASYGDVQTLLETCPEELLDLVVTHGRGASLVAIAESMPAKGILLTPAGWEGLSPKRPDDHAFWSQIALLRNPTGSVDMVQTIIQSKWLERYHSPQRARELASRGLMRQEIVKTTHRIRQGIGRGIRHNDDNVDIIIYDPRFPRPADHPLSGVRVSPLLVGAIPFRFLSAYQNRQSEKNTNEEVGEPSLIL